MRRAIGEGLLTVLSEIEGRNSSSLSTELEDIHMNVEARLRDLIGAPAGRLHTGRSRNDQVALDFRMWVRDQCDAAIAGLRSLQVRLLDQAEAGATGLCRALRICRSAQPVTWGHHMMAYVEMLGRDVSRFQDARARMNEARWARRRWRGRRFRLIVR